MINIQKLYSKVRINLKYFTLLDIMENYLF